MKRIVLSLAIIAALSTPILHAKEQLKILSTIKPVHSLVSAVGGDLVSVEQVIPDNASPHHYSLKPSDLRKISKAALIFRIDPKLESFLNKSLRSVSADKVITLSQAKKLTLLEAKAGHDHDERHDDDEEQKDDEHEAEEFDYHLWLNPDNAIAMANSIRDSLSKIAPENAEQLTKNTQLLTTRIQKKHQEITEQLKDFKDTPFLVMHDAWQYFTSHYQLKQIGTISAQERLKTSARALSKARSTIKDSNVKCLLAEPNLKQRTLSTLTENLSVNIGQIDPLGRNIPESDQAYTHLLQYTADKLSECLKQK
jgi:zinc transport system substrate-binding protein